MDSDSQEDYQEVDNPLDIKDPLPNSPRLPPVSFDQELISIMEAFKRGDHSLDQTEAHVQDLWKRVKTGGNSFEQKRVSASNPAIYICLKRIEGCNLVLLTWVACI